MWICLGNSLRPKTVIACGLLSSVGFSPGAHADEQKSYVVGALGDSITTAFNSSGLGDHKNLSWSTGENASGKSHAQRIKQLLGQAVVVNNQAAVGATAKHLSGQVEKLIKFKPDYVTLLMGANDLCEMSAEDPNEILSRIGLVEAALMKLVESNQDIKILLVAIPNMPRLKALGVQHGCQKRWNILGLCKPLLGRDVTESQMEVFKETYQSFNQELRHLADKYAGNVRFADRPEAYEFSWDEVSSLDCFHPSLAGQNRLAELTFDPSWF